MTCNLQPEGSAHKAVHEIMPNRRLYYTKSVLARGFFGLILQLTFCDFVILS